jgi:hypothetical protein
VVSADVGDTVGDAVGTGTAVVGVTVGGSVGAAAVVGEDGATGHVSTDGSSKVVCIKESIVSHSCWNLCSSGIGVLFTYELGPTGTVPFQKHGKFKAVVCKGDCKKVDNRLSF